MLGILNKKKALNYKLNFDFTSKQYLLNVISFGEQSSINFFNKIMEAPFQQYVNITSGEFLGTGEACEYYDSLKSDI